MSFDSIPYLVFLPSVFALHRLVPAKWRYLVLLAASLVFYACWNPPLTLLLCAVIGVSYLAGRLISSTEKAALRRTVMAVSIVICIGLLIYFKYFGFLAESLEALLGCEWNIREIVLPIGISFYTFQALSYVIDVYRDSSCVEKHMGYYALYISFFPQLVAGPIERSGRLLPQLRSGNFASSDDIRAGVRILLSGYFRKIVIADFCATFVNTVFSSETPDGSAVFLGVLLFSFQIYNDFAGYSEIARGSARLFGINLMRNFERPYLSCGFREFWRRWHISLSQWFRDYLYIPLGGSRHGLLRQIAATMIVFAVSGLWHGAKWTFLIWGLIHGVIFASELLIARHRDFRNSKRWVKLCAGVLTFLTVSFAWIFFRAESISHAGLLLGRLFSPWNLSEGLSLLGMGVVNMLWLAAAISAGGLLHRITEDDKPRLRNFGIVYLAACIIFAWIVRLGSGTENAFIYFQF